VKERPILFSAPMVRAILAGTKTVTRRIVHERSPHWVVDERDDGTPWLMVARDSVRGANLHDAAWLPATCPYGAPGDRLWVRETHFAEKAHAPDDYPSIHYAADMEERQHDGHSISPPIGKSRHNGPWTPSIHMRRAYSRLILEATAVRVERLQDVSDEDAAAEGVEPDTRIILDGTGSTHERHHRMAFARLWDGINGKRASWASNPFVWVVTFKRIDARSEAA
jgi:hypothetical protein